MIRQLEQDGETDQYTVWGLDCAQLHDRFWAARGIQVVRPGEDQPLNADAELYLLTDSRTLTIFRLGKLIDTLSWLKPRVLFIRLHSTMERGYREVVVTDEEDRLQGFKRIYSDSDARLARVAVTPYREQAELWQKAEDAPSGWRQLRRSVARNQRTAVSVDGSVYDRSFAPEVMQFMRELVQTWRRPDATVGRARRMSVDVWGDIHASADADTRFIGPVWVGAGRSLNGVGSVVGPAVLWDSPSARPEADKLDWSEITPSDAVGDSSKNQRMTRFSKVGKRVFDITFALIALALTLPIYPIVMLAIWLEDGRPFFFPHRRETLGGREFPCLKFRSMRKNAEEIKAALVAQNKADGPQFFMDHDPRLTRTGRFLRATNIDELPQFFNVLLGHMSIVGPRPSPRSENQYCPPWREARLSVRPGITGLWQVKRSRAEGLDFQEWIRYDIEYVENMSFFNDLRIIWQTILHMAGFKPS